MSERVRGGTERLDRPRSQLPAKGDIIAWRLTLPEQLKIKEDKPNVTRRSTVYDQASDAYDDLRIT